MIKNPQKHARKVCVCFLNEFLRTKGYAIRVSEKYMKVLTLEPVAGGYYAYVECGNHLFRLRYNSNLNKATVSLFHIDYTGEVFGD